MRGCFAEVRRAGFDTGISTGNITRAMVDVLLQRPLEAPPSKDIVVRALGLPGQMSKTCDITSAWNSARRQIVRERPDKFSLDGKVLRRASDMEDRPQREKLSTAGHRKLATLAAKKQLSPDQTLDRLISSWRAARRAG